MTKLAHHHILAKRIKYQRLELYARLALAEKSLRGMLDAFKASLIKKVASRGTHIRNLPAIQKTLHLQIVLLRLSMKVWMNALIRDAVKMGFRHPGDALKPIFKDNQEALTDILAEQALFEARLSFGLDQTFSKQASPDVKTSSKKWTTIGQRIINNVAKKNLKGLTVSERIWDLTSRAESDLKRIIANGVGQGVSPYEIAKKIEKYVSPKVGEADELGIQSGPGVYRSPYKNAMRLARTETNRAYTQASAKFYQNKPWVSEVDITLSSEHDVADECDDLADAGPYSPEEAGGLIPAHPHCMCLITPRIDPEYLGQEEAD